MTEQVVGAARGVSNLTTLYLSPTNVCEYSCVMCSNQMTGVARGFIDWDLFRRLVNVL
jgi:hypothetical protein